MQDSFLLGLAYKKQTTVVTIEIEKALAYQPEAVFLVMCGPSMNDV